MVFSGLAIARQIAATHARRVSSSTSLSKGARVADTLRRLCYSIQKKLLGRPDYLEEILFWEETLVKRPPEVSDPKYKEEAFPEYLRALALEWKNDGNKPLRLLEIGSGPVSLLAYGMEQGLFEVTAIDPLASVYDEILSKYGISYPIKPRTGYAERLVKSFGKDSFDIVYSSNSLDHTISPKSSLSQMVQVVKTGGIVFLEGFVCEGSHAKWTGLHQHDLFAENGSLMHRGPKGHLRDLTGDLGLECIHEKVTLFKERSINAFGYEVPPGLPPSANWQFRDWFTIVFRKV